MKAFKCVTLMPDLLSSLEPSNNILGVFFFFWQLFIFPRVSYCLFFFKNHLLLSYCHCSSSQAHQPAGYFTYPPFFPEPLFSSSLIWLLSRPATQLSSGIFLYYFTRLVLLLSGSHIFSLSPFSFFREKNAIFRWGEWISGCPMSHPWRIQLLWLQISYNPPCSASHLISALHCPESWASWPFCQADGLPWYSHLLWAQASWACIISF